MNDQLLRRICQMADEFGQWHRASRDEIERFKTGIREAFEQADVPLEKVSGAIADIADGVQHRMRTIVGPGPSCVQGVLTGPDGDTPTEELPRTPDLTIL